MDIATLDRRARALVDLGCRAIHGESLKKHLRRARCEHWSAWFTDYTIRDARWTGWLIEHIATRMRRTPEFLLTQRYPYLLLPQWPYYYAPYEPRLSRRRVNLERLHTETLRVADRATGILFGLPLEEYVAILAATGQPLVCGELDILWRVGRRAEYDNRHRPQLTEA